MNKKTETFNKEPMMPVIKIWCLPKSSEGKLKKVFDGIVKAVEGVRELGLKGKHSMTVLFPPDMMKFGLGTEIIIEVTGLFKKPQRSEKVRSRLAERLGKAIKEHFPKAMIECFVFPFDPKKGFWTSRVIKSQPKPVPTREFFPPFCPMLRPNPPEYYRREVPKKHTRKEKLRAKKTKEK